MRYLFFLLILLLGNNVLMAQSNITGLEYFIDEDPGVGKGTYRSITASDSLKVQVAIPETELSPGFHYLGVRVVDESGKWSNYLFRSFKVMDTSIAPLVDTATYDLSGFEYFTDKDPGVGKGTFVAANQQEDSTTQQISIPQTDTLKPGFHYLGIRTQDESGKWSNYLFRSFKVIDTNAAPLVDTVQYPIVAYEYFIDEYGNIIKDY